MSGKEIIIKEPSVEPDMVISDIIENPDEHRSSCTVQAKSDSGEFVGSVQVFGGDGLIDPAVIRSSIEVLNRLKKERELKEHRQGMLGTEKTS